MNTNTIDFITAELQVLEKGCEEMMGLWNGKDEVGEDRAHIADDIIEKTRELLELLAELKETF